MRIKSVNKPLSKLYPERSITIGDHLRTKRLDLGLRQKDLVNTLGSCHKTILLWENNRAKPHPEAVSKINNFLGYCLAPETPAKHFGDQLRLFRVQTYGKSIFELATEMSIDEGTLSDIEQKNIIRYQSVFNSLSLFLNNVDWSISKRTKAEFTPTLSRLPCAPRFHSVTTEPKTLGGHIALKRRQLNLRQQDVMSIIGVKSASAYRSWERNLSKPEIKYYPEIMKFIEYCPIQYAQTPGQRLKLFRVHLGLSFRQVDKLLSLSKGCTYRIEISTKLNNQELTWLLEEYYKHRT